MIELIALAALSLERAVEEAQLMLDAEPDGDTVEVGRQHVAQARERDLPREQQDWWWWSRWGPPGSTEPDMTSLLTTLGFFALTGLFIPQGPVVQVRDPDGTPTIDEDPDPGILYQGPLVVLTSRMSASASEIVAGALQDHRHAF